MNSIHSLFSIYGLIIAGTLTLSQWRGWSLDRVNEYRSPPKSLRDNPGAWRGHYGSGGGAWGIPSGGSGGGRYTGGK